MESRENKPSFNYTYSAKQQEEIKNIRKKYLSDEAPEEDKMERLRRLDKSASKKASVVSLIVGIIGVLILGFGMSLTMTELYGILGTDRNTAMLIGIGTGVLGIVLVSFAYPLYNRTLKKEREKIAPEILRLTDELMK